MKYLSRIALLLVVISVGVAGCASPTPAPTQLPQPTAAPTQAAPAAPTKVPPATSTAAPTAVPTTVPATEAPAQPTTVPTVVMPTRPTGEIWIRFKSRVCCGLLRPQTMHRLRIATKTSRLTAMISP